MTSVTSLVTQPIPKVSTTRRLRESPINPFHCSLELSTVSLTDACNTVKRAIASAPPNDAYLHWHAPGVETVKDNENETAEKIGVTMNKMQQYNFDQQRHAFRATHVKTGNSQRKNVGLIGPTEPLAAGTVREATTLVTC